MKCSEFRNILENELGVFDKEIPILYMFLSDSEDKINLKFLKEEILNNGRFFNI